MINFNVPPAVGDEVTYIQDAINYIKDNCDKKQMEITKSCNNEEKNLNIPKYLYSCIITLVKK